MSRRYGSIYKITNTVNGKSYVGQTIESIGSRWSKHKYKNSHSSIMVQAMRKYGVGNFQIEELFGVIDPTALSEMEIYFIKKFNTLSPGGYNAVLPDENYVLSPQMRANKSIAGKRAYYKPGFKAKHDAAMREPERLAKISAAAKSMWAQPGRREKMSQESTLRNSDPVYKEKQRASITATLAKKFKPICQYTMDLTLVRTFHSKKEILEAGFVHSQMRRCCSDPVKSPTSQGYIWTYEGTQPKAKGPNPKGIRLIAINIETQEEIHLNNTLEASRLGVDPKNVQRVLKNGRGKSGSFTFVKQSEYLGDAKAEIEKRTAKKNRKKSV